MTVIDMKMFIVLSSCRDRKTNGHKSKFQKNDTETLSKQQIRRHKWVKSRNYNNELTQLYECIAWAATVLHLRSFLEVSIFAIASNFCELCSSADFRRNVLSEVTKPSRLLWNVPFHFLQCQVLSCVNKIQVSNQVVYSFDKLLYTLITFSTSKKYM